MGKEEEFIVHSHLKTEGLFIRNKEQYRTLCGKLDEDLAELEEIQTTATEEGLALNEEHYEELEKRIRRLRSELWEAFLRLR